MKNESGISMGEGNMDGPKLTEISQSFPAQAQDREGSVGVGVDENLKFSKAKKRGGSNSSKMQKPGARESQAGGSIKPQLQLIDGGKDQTISASNEKGDKGREKELEEDIQYADRMATDYGSFGIETQKGLEEFKITVIGKDGNPVNKTGVEVCMDIHKEVVDALKTGKLSEKAGGIIGEVDKLLEQSDKSEAGRVFRDELYRRLGFGNVKRGENVHKWLRKKVDVELRGNESQAGSEEVAKSGFEVGVERQTDVNDLVKTVGSMGPEINGLIKQATDELDDQETAMAAPLGDGNGEAGQGASSTNGSTEASPAPLGDSGERAAGVIPAPLRDGGGVPPGGGDVVPPGGGGQSASLTEGARGQDKAARAEKTWRDYWREFYKNKWVSGGALLVGILLLLYLGALGGTARFLERTSERTRAAVGNI